MSLRGDRRQDRSPRTAVSRLWATLSLLAAGAPLLAQGFDGDRAAARPAAQAGQHGTTSYMQKTHAWPAAGTHSLRFAYVVDSEAGGDFLNVYVDGNLAWAESGLNKVGVHALPVSGGVHTVRFEYAKNAAGSAGRDTAIVDDVELLSSSGSDVVHRFDRLGTLATTGWSTGGAGGGFALVPAPREQSAGSPAAQRGVDSSLSYMEKTLTWGLVFCPQPPDCPTWEGGVAFDYLVDSEPDGDRLRVRIDGVVRWSASGRQRSGTARVAIPGPGPHTVRFEYVKNGGVSAGRDLARVDRVTFIQGDRRLIELHDFSARQLGTTPIRVGSGGAGEWVSGGTGGGWTVHRSTPNHAYVPAQSIGSQLRQTYLPFAEPVIDGLVTGPAEYRNPTSAQIPNYGHPGGSSATLRWVASATSGALFTGLVGQADTPPGGGERGRVHLFLDAGRAASLDGRGECAGAPRAPGPSDRRIRFAYRIRAGETAATVRSYAEEGGTCGAGGSAWSALAGEPPLLPDPGGAIRISKAGSTPGWLHFEIRLPLPATALAEGHLGFGLFRRSIAPTPSWERVPAADGGGPLPDDVLTWETLVLSLPDSKRDLFATENLQVLPLVPDRERRRLFHIR